MSSYIEVKNVSKSFSGRAILQNISLPVEQGTTVGLVGANGSGKSVLFKIICGFEKPDQGSVATADRYDLMINTYTIPRIGNIKLTKLTSRDLQKLYKDLMEKGRERKTKTGAQGLSSTTVRSVHLMLHCAFERAVKERLIPRNPTDDCIAPKVRKFEMKILEPEHMKAYLDAANVRGLLPMFYLELVSGLRKGELVALLWSDLDIKNRTISVSKQYIKNPNGELTLSRPKTETSVRKVSIPQMAVDLLIQEHEKHPRNPYICSPPLLLAKCTTRIPWSTFTRRF